MQKNNSEQFLKSYKTSVTALSEILDEHKCTKVHLQIENAILCFRKLEGPHLKSACIHL